MGNITDKLPLLLPRSRQARQHLIKRMGQPQNLLRGVRQLQTSCRQVIGRNGASYRTHLLEGRQGDTDPPRNNHHQHTHQHRTKANQTCQAGIHPLLLIGNIAQEINLNNGHTVNRQRIATQHHIAVVKEHNPRLAGHRFIINRLNQARGRAVHGC